MDDKIEWSGVPAEITEYAREGMMPTSSDGTTDAVENFNKESMKAENADIKASVSEIANSTMEDFQQLTNSASPEQSEVMRGIRRRMKNKVAARRSRQRKSDKALLYKAKINTADWIRENYLIPCREDKKREIQALKNHNNALVDQALVAQGLDPKEFTLKNQNGKIVPYKLDGQNEPEGSLRI